MDRKNIVLSATLIKGRIQIAQSIYYFLPEKELSIPKTKIDIAIKKNLLGCSLTLQSKKLAKSVCLAFEVDGVFSDNFFDLLPSQKKIVNFSSANPDCKNFGPLLVKTLADTFN